MFSSKKLDSLAYDQEKTGFLDIPIFEYEEDMFENLKLSNLMRKLQEIASYDVVRIGYTHEKIASLGLIYVLSWSSLVITRDLKVGEKPRFLTSPRVPKGSRMYRDIWVEDEQGERVVEASTVWACIDIVDRKVQKAENSPIPYAFQAKTIQIPDAKKIHIQKEVPFIGHKIARFTDMDVNRHMNNCQYADLFCNFSGINFFQYRISAFHINYRKEILLGEKISLYGKILEDYNIAYMHGETEQGICFVIEAELEPVTRLS